MRTGAVLLIVGCLLAAPATAKPVRTETIVMVRHGEKPPAGLGQLSCQGLNRALALGPVLRRQFPDTPRAVFAPDPGVGKDDHHIRYDYIRPLATIEPAAIALGLPVNAHIGVADLPALQRALTDPALRDALVLVAWEHTAIVTLARALLASYGGRPDDVPDWDTHDFDSIYVVRLMQDGTQTRASFEHRHEGLDGQKTTCVTPTP